MFKVKKHQNNTTDVVLVFLLLTLNIIITFSSVSIFDFEEVSDNWASFVKLKFWYKI